MKRPFNAAPAATSDLATNTLGVGGVVFLVLAAVAPLTGIVVIATLGIALGNGGGMPAAFIVTTVILLLFAVGYAQMSKKLVSAGGFYAVVVKGLGRPMGVAAGFTAMLGYNCFVAGALGVGGFFASTIIETLTGLSLPWFVWSMIVVVLIFVFTRRGIGFSARLLGVCLVLEVSILILLDLRILAATGYSMEAFAPQTVTTGSVGIALLFAANAFVGFEATGLFAEEAKDPRRTIPRATYIAITFIGVFAAVTTWAIVSALGVAQAQSAAIEHLPTGDLVFMLSEQYLGTFLTNTMMVLLLVSLFAAILALHNSATRYIYAHARVGILPSVLARTRNSNGCPQNASLAQLSFGLAVAAIYFALGLDPMTSLTPSMTGFGTLAILTLQALAAAAITVYFTRTRDPRVVRAILAPAAGSLGLATVVTLAIVNFSVLAGSEDPVIGRLPWLLALCLVSGVATAFWLKARRPTVYANLRDDMERYDLRHGDTAAVPTTVPTTTPLQ
ncbi:APC family permease [Mycobacterium sp. DL99]|uniref:APC family permease n=1 Tax=Mycobacterium sp. DL99 TaxID=2528957 RepID=UPI001081588D|nr:APC family permease [Mycobacterium sp. DL99]